MNELPQSEQIGAASQALKDARAIWTKIPVLLRFLFVAILLVGVVFAAAYRFVDTVNYRTLCKELSTEDMAAVVGYLKENRIEYKLEGNGSAVMVPGEKVYDTRLDLAAVGLPTGGGVGFELFDQQKFGMTEFEEQVAMKRAQEGELTRTISQIRSIKSARVHLVLPKRSLFRSDTVRPSASVVLDLSGSAELSSTVVPAIVHLVSASVEGLTPEDVTIVDTRGKLLSSDNGSGGSIGSLDLQHKFERDLESRIGQMLTQTLGPDASVVKVNGEFDFTTEETTAETYDPDNSVLRSEHLETERNGAKNSVASGVPGSRSNLPGGNPPSGGGAGSAANREVEIRNFEVSKLVHRTVSPHARLKRISVAVLVNGENPPDKPFVARSAGELKNIETAIRGAIGYDKQRGDNVEVISVPFQPPVVIEAVPELPIEGIWWWWIPVAGVAAVIIAMLALLMLRGRRGEAFEQMDYSALPLPANIRELEGVISGPAAIAARGKQEDWAVANENVVNQMRDVFSNERESAAKVLKAWISEAQVGRAEARGD